VARGGEFGGMIPLRMALAVSRNVECFTTEPGFPGLSCSRRSGRTRPRSPAPPRRSSRRRPAVR
jgi:hypothetical protein